jgi:alpha-tubulin suppressor-like RCC1 family protein/Leucine-rich repeat (LRR) protein
LVLTFFLVLIFIGISSLNQAWAANSRVSAGSTHSLAVLQDGTLWAWGDNTYGELGTGTSDLQALSPVQIGTSSNWVAVSAGGGHSLGLNANHEVYAWGWNDHGQLGLSDTVNRNTPNKLPTLSNVIAIAAGMSHSMAIDGNGDLWIWGYNYYGQLGSGNTTDSNIPIKVNGISNGTTIKVIAVAGDNHTLALTDDGKVYAWGNNSNGELGLGYNNPSTKTTPTEITNPGWNVVALSAGMGHSLALDLAGQVWAWGFNQYGQLGLGNTNNYYTPNKITAINNIHSISAGGWFSLATKADDGTLWSWGNDYFGQLGQGNPLANQTPHSSPVEVLSDRNLQPFSSAADQVVQASAGNAHSLALKQNVGNSSDSFWAWGVNGNGRLGVGNLSGDQNRPVQIFFSFIIAASAGLNGQISPSGDVPVGKNANQTFTITANPGYQVADVLVDGISHGSITTYTFNSVTANHTVSATFVGSAYDTLNTFYNSTGGTSWFHKYGWGDPNVPECNWDGVLCDGSKNIIQLSLPGNNLSGNIPNGLVNLTSLQHLDLSGNKLTGSIPAGIAGLTNLKDLLLHGNQLSGEIPSELGNLTGLLQLDLGANQLTGSIPTSLGNLTSLQALFLNENQLTGGIPSQLGNLITLQTLDLDSNQLTGPIPDLTKLKNLQLLILQSNQLTGSIPSSLGTLANLQGLWLNMNRLDGSIPPELGSLKNLASLNLSNNTLTGSIPVELGSLANLQIPYLYSNQLTGSIPSELGKLINLLQLYLANNQLTGSIPDELGNLTYLLVLMLYDNHLTGSIPSTLGNLKNLQHLWLDRNRLTGSIPSSLGNLANLVSLHLSSNKLTGAIPSEISSLPNLTSNGSDLRWNALYTANSALRDFLNSKQNGGLWENTQTVAPTGLTAGTPTGGLITLSWTSIPYTGDTGGYSVFSSTTPGGPYASLGITADKMSSSLTVTEIDPTKTNYFVVLTVTNPHLNNQNTVISEPTPEVSVGPATTYPLSITMPGSGTGLVKSQVNGISCGVNCSNNYISGTVVQLTAIPNPGSYFSGWSGDACSHNFSLTCLVTVDSAKAVTATFTSGPPTVSTWAKTFGGSNDNLVHSIQQTSDGGYIVAGKTFSTSGGKSFYWVFKLDKSGNVLWNKTYGATTDDEAFSIQQTSDGGYIVAGNTQGFGTHLGAPWVLKLDQDGKVQWQKTYDGAGSGNDEPRSIQQTSDGGYILAGGTNSFSALFTADY